jgi:serine/threonine-protein kinase
MTEMGDRYRVIEQLKRGGIATSFKAIQHPLERFVVIKQLHSDLAGDHDLVARFEREARACAQLKHQNIVGVFDYGHGKESAFIVFEYVEGTSLRGLLERCRRLPETVTAAIAVQLARALAYAHGKGVIHRDVKPGNVLVSREGVVKLGDFGLASVEGLSSLTLEGELVGTPAYMSPEQAEGRKVDQRSDIYSLGLTIYEMLIGRRAFEAPNFALTLTKLLTEDPAPLRTLDDALDGKLADIVDSMLVRTVDERSLDAAGAVRRLESYLEDSGLHKPEEVVETFLASQYLDLGEVEARPPGGETGVSGRSGSGEMTLPRRGAARAARTVRWAAVVVPLIFLAILVVAWAVRRQGRQSSAVPRGIAPGDASGVPSLAEGAGPADSEIEIAGTSLEQAESADAAESNGGRGSEEGIESTGDLTGEIAATAGPVTELGNARGGAPGGAAGSVEEVPREGSLKIIVEPWARVMIGGEFIDTTPLAGAIDLPAGTAEITLVHPDYPPYSETLVIGPGETGRLVFSFSEWVSHLDLVVIPWGEVYLDGEYAETTPVTAPIRVAPGEHTVTVHHPSLGTWERVLAFARGSTVHLEVDMRSLTGSPGRDAF